LGAISRWAVVQTLPNGRFAAKALTERSELLREAQGSGAPTIKAAYLDVHSGLVTLLGRLHLPRGPSGLGRCQSISVAGLPTTLCRDIFFPSESPLRYSHLIIPGAMAMHAVSVSGLKNNPAEALRQSKQGVVVVLNRDHPDAVLMGLDHGDLLQAPGVRPALATALFRDGELSLARAARVAQMGTSAFISHLSRLGIPVIRLSEAETNADLDTLEQWLQSSSATPAR
jgi:predicted HTH domain antitoxin